MVTLENDRIREAISGLRAACCHLQRDSGLESLFNPRIIEPCILPRHAYTGGGIEVTSDIAYAGQTVRVLYDIARITGVYVSCGERKFGST